MNASSKQGTFYFPISIIAKWVKSNSGSGASHFLVIVALCFLPVVGRAKPARSQVSADSTLSTNVVTTDGLNFTINVGNQVGDNLFHSFRAFSVPTNGSARFNHAVDVQNIIARVTGERPSSIDGLIQANAAANLFLINPNGLIFGPNAALNIGGSFISSTADSLLFEDGVAFSAVAPEVPPLLTINTPIGLAFGVTPASVQVQGPGNRLRQDAETGIVIGDDRPIGLQVQPNRTLGLIGGEVILAGGNLTALDGRIELGGVAGNSTVTLIPIAQGWSITYDAVENFQDIRLSQAASINGSGDGGGTIHIQGQNITLAGGAVVLANTLGTEAGESLMIEATDLVEFSGANVQGLTSTLITDVMPGTLGRAGSMTITARQLRLNDGAQIRSFNFGQGNSGNLTIQASESVKLRGSDVDGIGSTLLTEVTRNASGNAGNINLVTRQLVLEDGAQISSLNLGQGNSGDVAIQASELITLEGISGNGAFSAIATQVFSGALGDAGDVTLATGQLVLDDGAQLASSTSGQGNSGNLAIQASTSIELKGASGAGIPTVLGTQVGLRAIGNTGDVIIETDQLRLQDGAFLVSATLGQGDSGNLTLRSRQLRVDDGAQILSATFGQGNSGNLTIAASESVEIRGVFNGERNSIVSTQVAPDAIGDAGDLTIATAALRLGDGAQVTSATFGNGSSGNLTIRASESVELMGQSPEGNGSTVSSGVAQLGTGNAGTLTIATNRLILQDAALITSATLGLGDANDLRVEATDSIL
ncbi:MAG: filamentous hemagglutinin N-terminal domain-containing protein, partial [Cyanothece sp. SIO1E1]|nr:filamentous hemagglutinin N-terminal domain-containing protein [Cyanothece sp. SIO1E1]